MGLMDILNGMQNGPRGTKPPAGSSTSSGSGMSPITMALLGLLAYKAMKHFGGSSGTTPATPSLPPGGGTTSTGGLGDVLGGLLGGKPGGLPGGSSGAPGGGLGDVLGGLLGGKPGGSSGAPGGGLGDILGGLLGGKPGGAGGGLGGLPGGLGGLLAGGAAGSVLSGGLDKLLKDLQSSGHGTTAQSWVSKGDNEEIAPGDLEKALGADAINALTNQTGMSRSELLDGLSKNLPELVDQLTPDGRLPTEHEAARW
jgi:uncharacterized protein YidB (DUF937 family)